MPTNLNESISAHNIASAPVVAWSAIFAGAFAAASLSIILFILGSGLGLSFLSPWSHVGPSAVTLTAVTVGWLIFMQWVSSGLGGYLAGRLRTKYVSVHTDEGFFRDTAHGFLAWAVATVVIVTLSASAVSSGIMHGSRALGAAVGAGAKLGADKPMPPMGGPGENNMYVLDTLFRTSPASTKSQPLGPAAPNDDREVRAETMRIIMTDLKNGDVPQADKTYLAQVVAKRANISQDEAQKRVDDTIEHIKSSEQKVKEAADTARKTGATLSIFTALSMFIGAFIACIAGALGGKRRDEYQL